MERLMSRPLIVDIERLEESSNARNHAPFGHESIVLCGSRYDIFLLRHGELQQT